MTDEELQNLNEAPASVNFYGVTSKGWNIQITLRDVNWKNLMHEFSEMTQWLEKNPTTDYSVEFMEWHFLVRWFISFSTLRLFGKVCLVFSRVEMNPEKDFLPSASSNLTKLHGTSQRAVRQPAPSHPRGRKSRPPG